MRTPQVIQLVPAVALAALLIVLPASASAPETQAPCAAPTFYGYVDDFEAWFRYPPGAEGRNAEHITEAVVDFEITDSRASRTST